MTDLSQSRRHASAILVCLFAAFGPISAVLAESASENAGLSGPTGQTAMLAPAMVEASGAMIGTVTITNGSIFDLDNPEENKVLYRLANRAHATTRPHVIKQQLLFETGDRFSAQVLAESERIIRSNRYVQEASIQTVRQEDGVVDVNVITTDVWTLMPKLSFSRSGGKSKAAIGLKEGNLFGTGVSVEAMYRSDVDRDSRSLKLEDRNLGSSWYGLSVGYANNSDGDSQFLDLGKPFYSLDSRDARGISFRDDDRVESFYDRGEIGSEYRHEAKTHELFLGWSSGLRDGWTRRYTAGLSYDDHRFSPVSDSAYPITVVPENRKFLTPFIGIEFVEDQYEKTSNLDQINRTEDRYLGTRMSARLGLARAGAGSDRNAWLLNVVAQTGFGSSEKSSLLLASELGGRVEQGGMQNLALDLSARYYKRQSDRRLLYAALSGTYGHSLDLDQYLVLGGNNGLRGYPLRFQTGDKRALFTLEQRFFTEWYPFRLFRVGGAVFFDVGRTWGDGPLAASDNQLLKDVGVGLRLGNTRSGLGRMIHVDVAVPLNDNDGIDSVQLLISTRTNF